MKNVMVLGATGRTGNFIITELGKYDDIKVTAAIRSQSDFSRIPKIKSEAATVIVDINSVESLRQALLGIDIVVNALRLREGADASQSSVAATALVELDQRIREASTPNKMPLILSVGGAGSLRMLDKTQFWQNPAFPERTFPRGKAQAKLRDYLDTLSEKSSWSYLIPPPIYDFKAPRTGHYDRFDPSHDESDFLSKNVSYQDFAIAVCDAVRENWTGTHLIGNGK